MNHSEFFVILVLALVLIGPRRLPVYAAMLSEWVKKARSFAVDAKTQVKEELGPDLDDIDWKQYDPRQYDPRKIVRDALAEPLDESEKGEKPEGNDAEVNRARTTAPPFDDDAT